jgi:hypothetical protein
VEIVSVESPAVKVGGKNLLENTLPTHTSGGITYTSNADGSVTLNGTSVGESYFIFDHKNEIPIREVPLVASLGGGNGQLALAMGCYKNDGSFVNSLAYIVDREAQVAYPQDATTTRNYLVVGNGHTFNNMTVYPMLRAPGTPADFEPYKPVQTIETAHPLRGIPVTTGGNYTDENGQQWICDEVDFERGVYVQRTKSATLTDARNIGKSLPNDEASWMYYYVTPNKEMNDTIPVLCDSLQYKSSLSPHNSIGFRNSNDGNSVVYFNMSTYMTENSINALGAVLNERPITFVYSLVKPIETPLTETELAAYRTLHTNKPNTTILNDSGAHMSVKYTADTKLYIDKKIKEALQ